MNTIGSLAITQTYTYDSLNRLQSTVETSSGGGGWTETEGYDRYGNRWLDLGGGVQSLSFNTANNRITGKTYDPAGNLTADGTTSYGYDAENHMISLNSATGYSYDGEGRRVRKLIGENTRFVYGITGELIQEFNAAPSATSVTWTNVVGATATGSSLTKTAADAWGNVGASSTQSIASGNGYVEFTACETNKYRMLGLSHGDSNQDYSDIDFAIYLLNTGAVRIYESGSIRSGKPTSASTSRRR